MADAVKKPITDEIATAAKDIDIFAGYLGRLENPDPVLRTEAAGKGLKLYDEVDRDAHAGSVLQTRRLAVAGCEWEVIPADAPARKGRPASATREQQIADFVQAALSNIGLTGAVNELLQAILYGFYAVEVMWTAADGKWLPARLIAKHPRRFVFTDTRELRLLTPASMIDGEPVPERKFIVFSWGDSDNPYGQGLGQKLWWPVWFKKNGIKFWLVFLEKFGMPTVVGKYPPGTAPDQQKALLNAIDAIQHDTGVKIPETMALELLEATRTGNAGYEQLCAYMDKQISKAVLGQTATTEGTPGKLGSDDAQDDVRQDLVKADADLVCEALNATIVRWIVDLNFGPQAAYPTLWLRTEPEADLKGQAERDKILASDIGVPVGRRYFYDAYGIPEPETGEALVAPPAKSRFDETGQAIASARPFADPALAVAFAKSEGRKIDPGAFDGPGPGATLEALYQVADPELDMADLIGPVATLMGQVNSLEELRDRLLDVYGDMDPARLGEMMQRALVAADMAGRYDGIA